jgi:glycosyltransferase involved in cell wall biosynthesis
MPPKAAEPERHHRALYVGNFSQGSHWKAFDVLIKAWRRVVAAKPSASLVMVGGGDSTPWKRLARTLGCDGSIVWCGPTADPGPHYVNAAIFVLPSRIEGMSNALLEAQSHGLPCVVSGIPGNTAVVAHGVNGWVVPVGDDQALAAAILALLNDSACRMRLGNAARTRAGRHFSLDAVVGRLAGIYRLLRDRERS